jgi:hypothetical protein
MNYGWGFITGYPLGMFVLGNIFKTGIWYKVGSALSSKMGI